MKNTYPRRLVLERLSAGPMTTTEVCELLGVVQATAYQMMQRLADYGRVKNTGPKWRAKWELVK